MKQKVIPLLSAICMILCAGCTEDTAQSKQVPSASDTQQTVIDASSADAHHDASTNFLGGNGNLEIVDTRNALTMQDDEWFYCGSMKMKKDRDATPRIVSQCREAGCTHNSSSCILNRYYSGSNMLMSDGKSLYLAQANLLFTIDSQGNTRDFLTLETDGNGVSLVSDTVQIDLLRYIDESHIYISAYGYNAEDAYTEMHLIYNSKSNEVHPIQHEINANYTCTDSVTNAFYCISKEGEIIRIDLSDMQEEIVTEGLDDFPTFDGWTVQEDMLYYINQMGQYCQFDLKTSAKTLLYDKSPFYTYNVYLDEVYTIDESRTSILCGNAAWSESTKCCTTEAAIQGITAISEEVLFFYCEDGGRMLFLETGEVVPYESA